MGENNSSFPQNYKNFYGRKVIQHMPQPKEAERKIKMLNVYADFCENIQLYL